MHEDTFVPILLLSLIKVFTDKHGVSANIHTLLWNMFLTECCTDSLQKLINFSN